jgi:hypothetical protein
VIGYGLTRKAEKIALQCFFGNRKSIANILLNPFVQQKKQANIRPQNKQEVVQVQTTSASCSDDTSNWSLLDVTMIMTIFSFLNIRDTCRFAQTSKHGCFLVHCYYCLQGPQITMAASDTNLPNEFTRRTSPLDMQMTRDALKTGAKSSSFSLILS